MFANVQTAKVIFGAIDTSERKFVALPHVWLLLAFIAGIAPRVRDLRLVDAGVRL